MNATRELISKALRGDTAVVKDAVALLEAEAEAEAEADARTAAYYAEHDERPDQNADAMNAAIESLAGLKLDAAIDAAWNNPKGSMSDEDLAAWLDEDQTEARRESAESPAAGTTDGGAVAGRSEAAQGFGLARSMATRPERLSAVPQRPSTPRKTPIRSHKMSDERRQQFLKEFRAAKTDEERDQAARSHMQRCHDSILPDTETTTSKITSHAPDRSAKD